MTPRMKWALIVGAFLIVGGVSMIVGFSIAGFDIIGWFSTKYAMIVYIFVGIYAIILGSIIVMDYVRK